MYAAAMRSRITSIEIRSTLPFLNRIVILYPRMATLFDEGHNAKSELESLTITHRTNNNYVDLTIKVAPQFLYCDKGHTGDAVVHGVYQKWGLYFKCKSFGCGYQWVVCYICGQQKVRYTKKRTVYSHGTKHNDKKRPAASAFGSEDLEENSQKRQRLEHIPSGTQDCYDVNESDDADFHWSAEPDISSQDSEVATGTVSESFTPEINEAEIYDNGIFKSKYKIHFTDCPMNGSLGFSSPRNERFFQYCKDRAAETSFADAGVEYLTKTCAVENSYRMLPSDLRNNVTPMPHRFQKLLMNSAQLSFRQGKKDRQLFCEILNLQHENGCQDGWASCADALNTKFNSLSLACSFGKDYVKHKLSEECTRNACNKGSHVYSRSFPKSTEDIRKQFISGKNSILRNLPHPEVKSDIPNHAYVSIEDCIRDALGHSKCQVQVIDKFSPSECHAMRWTFTKADHVVHGNVSVLSKLMLQGHVDLENMDEGLPVTADEDQECSNFDPSDDIDAESNDDDEPGKSGTNCGSDDDSDHDDDSHDASSMISEDTEDSSTPAKIFRIDDADDDLDDDDSISVTEQDVGDITNSPDNQQENGEMTISIDEFAGDTNNPSQYGFVSEGVGGQISYLSALRNVRSDIRSTSQPYFNPVTATVDHPSRSKRALQIWFNAIGNDDEAIEGRTKRVVSYIKFWSDDCDTNSQSMAGRAQVWVKTMTIATTSDNSNLVENTYPVAIGLKGTSHDEVEAKHTVELRKLQSPSLPPFYCGETNAMVNCHFEVMVNLGDQPEKRDINGVARGNATWAARSFVSANNRILYPRLKACAPCFEIMCAQLQVSHPESTELPRCTRCLNWDVLQSGTSLSLVPIPPMYPYAGRPQNRNQPPLRVPGKINRVVIGHDGARYLRPFCISYESLRSAVEEAHSGFCQYGWSASHCRAFLSVECLDNKLIDRFLEYAKRAKAYFLATRDGASNNEARAALLAHQRNRPDLFERMPMPSIHNRIGVSLFSFIEALMHIIFLGVTKKSVGTIREAQALGEHEKEFRKTYGKCLQAVIALKLEWLKIMEYKSKKLHGWNAVNYLGFLRIMAWFYQNYSETCSRPHQVELIELPCESSQSKWTAKQNKYWLRLRRLKRGGTAAELSARVAKYMKEIPPPQPMEKPDVNGGDIEMLIMALQEMVKCIFQPVVTEEVIRRTELAIRVFLSSFDALDAKLRKPKQPAQVVTSYNFQCLMNIPQQMRDYGPLRDHWEGKKQGEAFLSEIKPWHKQGIRKNWAPNLLKNVLRDRCLKNLLGSSVEMNVSENYCSLCSYSGNFHKYSSIYEVRQILETKQRERKRPLSVIVAKNKSSHGWLTRLFAVIGSDYGVVEVRGMNPNEDNNISNDLNTRTKMGLHYYGFCLGAVSDRTQAWNEALENASSAQIGFAVLLPLLETNATRENSLFSVVASNWTVLGPKTTLSDLVDK